MDEFGVLVESIGFKAQGKSAPMAKLKSKPNFNSNNGFPQNIGINSTTSKDSSSFIVDDLDGIFRSNLNISNRKSHNYFDDDDIFGGPFSSTNQSGGIDLDSVFKSSSNSSNYKNSFGSNGHDDLMGLTPNERNSADDLFGNSGTKSSGLKGNKVENGPGFDDLIPGFGGTSPSNNGSDTKPSSGHSSNSDSKLVDDPFLVFESSVSLGDASWPFTGSVEQNAGKGSVQSSIHELEDFAMGKVQNDANTDRTGKLKQARSANDRPYPERIGKIKISLGKKKVDPNERELKGKQETFHKSQSTKNEERAQWANEVNKNGFENEDGLDVFFSSGVQPNHMARRSSTTEVSLFDTLFHEKRESEVKSTSSSSFNTKKASSMKNNVDDFSSLFGDDTSSGVFKEKEGESEERRRARLNHHMRTQARMAKALADKNQRDLQAQHEQEKRHMLAETMDNDIKRWAAGKEGNLRALLSSLQQVLWPECGWQQVSLTDLITSTSVKKVYYKATLCVHPDKVQQKGSNLQQKYIAEKVFDLLKEAWNKFNAEEMR
ncbi:Chaperone DnaJ-domain superfamily protein [Forsythia ovata]|uniref:Chaperone DnaJ-domain superfamily protein n=1 Tax=Forsythia ovata TaxID=205694 RepID=A0ABD1U4T9_9LAMI